MKFLDGLKTLIGAVGLVVTVVLPKVPLDVVQQVGDHVVNIAQGAFGVLTLLGIIHKKEKADAAKAAAEAAAARASNGGRR